MKVLYSTTSPYARKVWMMLWETGLIETVAMEIAAPWTPDTTVPHDNPLGKIPVLILDDGTHLYDSPVICEYLDTCHRGTAFFPASGPARWQALRRQALADGMMDATAATRIEQMFHPGAMHSDEWVNRQKAAVNRALDALEAEDLGQEFTIGHLAILCALGYLDLRLAELAWRTGRPRLVAWFDRESARRSFEETMPR